MTPTERHHLVRDLLLLSALALVMMVANIASGDQIRLHRESHVVGDRITLGHIAELEGQAAQALSDVVIARFKDVGPKLTVSLDGLRDTLETHNINWGRIALRGFTECTVFQKEEDDAQPEVIRNNSASGPQSTTSTTAPQMVGANVENELSIETPLSLRTRLNAFLVDFVGLPADQLRITHAESDIAALDQPRYGDFVFKPGASRGSLGRVPVSVMKVGDGSVEPFLRLSPTVERELLAVVAARKVSRGQTFTPGDLKIEQVTLTHASREPVTRTAELVGRVAGATITPGQPIMASDIRSPVLVKRGELLTVQCVVGGLVLRTTARAAEDGGQDDVITVRNLDTRERFHIRVTGRRAGVLIKPKKQSDSEKATS